MKVVDGCVMVGFFVTRLEEQFKLFACHQLIGGSDNFIHHIDRAFDDACLEPIGNFQYFDEFFSKFRIALAACHSPEV